MARLYEVSKNRVNLQEHTPSPVMPEVHASLNVQAERRDPMRLIRALESFGSGAAGFVAQRDDQNRTKGQQDELLGRVDPELSDSAAYNAGRAKQRVLSEGLSWFNTKREELNKLQFDDPNAFDFQAWKQGALQEYLATKREDPEALATANNMANRLLESVEAQYASNQAKIELADAENDVAVTLGEALRGGISTPEAFDSLVQQSADNTLMDRQEVLKLGFGMVASQIEAGDIELGERLQKFYQNDPVLGPRYVGSLEQGRRERQRQADQAKRAQINADFETWNSVQTKLASGRFTEGDAQELIDRGYADAPQVAGWLAQSRSRAEQLAEKAAKEAEDAAYSRAALSHIQLGEGRQFDPKFTQKHFDQAWSQAFLGWTGAKRQGDAPTAAQAANALAGVVHYARMNQTIPQGMKDYFSRFETSNPKLAAEIGESFLSLDAAGIGDFVRTHMDDGAHARLKVYQTLRGMGEDPQSVIESMTNAAVIEPTQAARIVNGKSRLIADAAAEIGEGSGNYQMVNRKITEMANRFVMLGRDATEAVALAKEVVKDSMVDVGGVMVEKKHFAREDIQDVMSEYMGSVVSDHLKELTGTDAFADSVTAMPSGIHPGSFMLMENEGGILRPIMVDGKTIMVTEQDMVTRTMDARRKRKAALEAMDTVFPDGLDAIY